MTTTRMLKDCPAIQTTLNGSEEEVVQALVESMRVRGYDKHRPVIVGVLPSGKKYIVDGHTRIKAAIRLGIEVEQLEIPFENKEAMVIYALKEQTERRNLTKSQKAAVVLRIAELRTATVVINSRTGNLHNPPMPTQKEMAKEAGVSQSTMTNMSALFSKSSDLLKDVVQQGILTYDEANWFANQGKRKNQEYRLRTTPIEEIKSEYAAFLQKEKEMEEKIAEEEKKRELDAQIAKGVEIELAKVIPSEENNLPTNTVALPIAVEELVARIKPSALERGREEVRKLMERTDLPSIEEVRKINGTDQPNIMVGGFRCTECGTTGQVFKDKRAVMCPVCGARSLVKLDLNPLTNGGI